MASLLMLVSPGPAAAVDDESAATVQAMLDANHTGGVTGYYLREVGGPVHASANSTMQWETASTIKTLVMAHALRQVAAGEVELDTQIPNPWVLPGSSGSCPVATGSGSNTLSFGLGRMMVQSDNPWTQALRDYFGDAAIAQTAADMGMDDTVLQHLIGCYASSAPDGFSRGLDAPNMLTLVDAGLMWEQMAAGFVGDWDTVRTFPLGSDNVSYTGGSPLTGAEGAFDAVIDAEAAALGLSAQGIAAFKADQRVSEKAGNYGGGGFSLRSIAGWSQIPFKDAFCADDPREFVHGLFIDQSTTTTGGLNLRTALAELVRERIRAALQSWVACEADLALTDVSFVDPPATFDVHTPTEFTIRHTIVNNGPAASIDVVGSGIVTVPHDCTAVPADYLLSASAPEGTPIMIDREVTVTCTQPSHHQIGVDAQIGPLFSGAVDPDPSNNQGSAAISPAVIAHADLAIIDLDTSELADTGLGDFLVGGQFSFDSVVSLENLGDTVNGLYDDAVASLLTRSVDVPAGMTGSVTVTDDEAAATVIVQPDGQPAIVHLNQPAGATFDLAGPGTVSVRSVHVLEPMVSAEVSARFALSCDAPGVHEVHVHAAIEPVDEHVLDPDEANDAAAAMHSVECVTPVAINVRPGNDKNVVRANARQRVPVAILTTDAGEYGLPMAFDATWVDPTEVRFGATTTLASEGGGQPFPTTLLLHDSFEPDDRTRDGDIDATQLFAVEGSGLGADSGEACLVGSYSPDGLIVHTFYGCDVVVVTE